jgi:hypothetical protein
MLRAATALAERRTLLVLAAPDVWRMEDQTAKKNAGGRK